MSPVSSNENQERVLRNSKFFFGLHCGNKFVNSPLFCLFGNSLFVIMLFCCSIETGNGGKYEEIGLAPFY